MVTNYSDIVSQYTDGLIPIPNRNSTSGVEYGDTPLINPNRLQANCVGISIIRGVVLDVQLSHNKGRYNIDIQTNNLGLLTVQAWDDYGDFINKVIRSGSFVEMAAQIAQYGSTMEDTLYRVDKIKYIKTLDSYSIIRGVVHDSTPMRRLSGDIYEFYIETTSPKGNGLVLCTINNRKGKYEGVGEALYEKILHKEGSWFYFRGARDELTIPGTCWLRDVDLIEEDMYEWNYSGPN